MLFTYLFIYAMTLSVTIPTSYMLVHQQHIVGVLYALWSSSYFRQQKPSLTRE